MMVIAKILTTIGFIPYITAIARAGAIEAA
jgi:hypothetical protein